MNKIKLLTVSLIFSVASNVYLFVKQNDRNVAVADKSVEVEKAPPIKRNELSGVMEDDIYEVKQKIQEMKEQAKQEAEEKARKAEEERIQKEKEEQEMLKRQEEERKRAEEKERQKVVEKQQAVAQPKRNIISYNGNDVYVGRWIDLDGPDRSNEAARGTAYINANLYHAGQGLSGISTTDGQLGYIFAHRHTAFSPFTRISQGDIVTVWDNNGNKADYKMIKYKNLPADYHGTHVTVELEGASTAGGILRSIAGTVGQESIIIQYCNSGNTALEFWVGVKQ